MPISGHTWQRCPVAELRNPLWRAAVLLDDCAATSPLSGWPGLYSAGVVDAMLALRHTRDRLRAQAAAAE